jgi:NAD(P)-dependent dehydrogenase (short-subunit alcohol dehydrogenase family)
MDDYSGMFDLTGRCALVIGGASGIGRASCFGLASFGAQVFCADIAIDQAKAIAQAIAAAGKSAEALPIDLGDRDSVAAAAARVAAPDVLLISPSINVRKPLLDYSEDEFDRVVGLNLKGVFLALKAFVPGMVARRKGSIIVFSSIRDRSSSRDKAFMPPPRPARCR